MKGILIIIYLVLVLTFGVGYVKNVISFCQSDFKAPFSSEAVRGVGIIIPVVGGIAGYVDMEDK